ncbi:MAG: M23 family metallopeptidase [Spirochaetaceae bacterium]|nr:M23 family metallopeptidase [Spirochaetaceae bacterium]
MQKDTLRRIPGRAVLRRRFFTVLMLAVCCPILLSGGGGGQDRNPTPSLPEAEVPDLRTAPAAEPSPPAAEAGQPEAESRFVLIPEGIRPGEPLAVIMIPGTGEGTGGLRAVLVNGQGQRLTRAVFFDLETESLWGTKPASGQATGGLLLAALLGVPSTTQPGPAGIRVERGTELVEEIPIRIGNRDFYSEEIALDEENTTIHRTPDPEKTREAEQLWAILNRNENHIYTTDPFVPPVSSTRRTGFFGDRRIFRYSDGKSNTSIHGGIDYGVPRGTRVGACAAGRVILARFRIVTGNSVIIEHLPGVYSLYYHLDTIRVTEGSVVGAGEILGESGSTGLATGPHLHWEIRVAGETTDPDAFLVRPILDKEVIFSKIQR